MRFLIQRVSEASVRVDGKTIGQIGKGFLVFVGISGTDDRPTADWMIRKLLGLRIFEDENGKINKSVADVNGSILIVSQFTLYWNCKKGNRPSFENAMPPQEAEEMYLKFVERITETGIPYATGEFGADMKVSLINDGPVTVWLDTKENL